MVFQKATLELSANLANIRLLQSISSAVHSLYAIPTIVIFKRCRPVP